MRDVKHRVQTINRLVKRNNLRNITDIKYLGGTMYDNVHAEVRYEPYMANSYMAFNKWHQMMRVIINSHFLDYRKVNLPKTILITD